MFVSISISRRFSFSVLFCSRFLFLFILICISNYMFISSLLGILLPYFLFAIIFIIHVHFFFMSISISHLDLIHHHLHIYLDVHVCVYVHYHFHVQFYLHLYFFTFCDNIHIHATSIFFKIYMGKSGWCSQFTCMFVSTLYILLQDTFLFIFKFSFIFHCV